MLSEIFNSMFKASCKNWKAQMDSIDLGGGVGSNHISTPVLCHPYVFFLHSEQATE